MRIHWDKVPKYMITIKPPFGNLGRIVSQWANGNGNTIYRLQSIVPGSREMCYDFYDFELSVEKED